MVPHKYVPLQGKVYDYKQNDTVRFTSLANEHPEQWYTTVTMGFKDALANCLTFSEVKATRQNHLDDFAVSFFRSTDRCMGWKYPARILSNCCFACLMNSPSANDILVGRVC